jgi:NAD dependent epimerase/dehydratase family enzyme
MRYLITGATGFIGKKLVNDLLKNDQNKIIILSRSRKKAEKIFGIKINCQDSSNKNKATLWLFVILFAVYFFFSVAQINYQSLAVEKCGQLKI